MVGESAKESVKSADDETKKTKKKKGVFSTLWNILFRARGSDFEKRLQHILKEEAAVISRMAKRSQSMRRMIRHLIILSVFCEVIAVVYAIMTTRSSMLHWKTRALRVLPMFLLPEMFFLTYSTLRSFSRMRDQKDHNTLEKLRAERQEKIDELKEKTNYYITQQLIQKYDPDPAAKAAAATVLASKLGADSGLKVYLGDNVDPNSPSGKSNDAHSSSDLRQRKQPLSRSSSMDSGSSVAEAKASRTPLDNVDLSHQNPLVVDHHPLSGSSSNNGGWIARLAALLVGEDPTQSYALICGNCHMHNGLARKEDFPYMTYYCPHCNALNRPKHADSHALTTSPPTVENAVEREETEGTPSSVTKASAAPAPAAAAEDISGS